MNAATTAEFYQKKLSHNLMEYIPTLEWTSS